MTPDARYVVFGSFATNLVPVDTNGRADVFVRDRVGGTTELVSVSTAGVQSDGDSHAPSISADGRYVAFASTATNLLDAPDANGEAWDVFLRDRLSGTTLLVSRSATGDQGNDSSSSPSISGDGRFVAFASRATNLVPGDQSDASFDVYLRDLLTGAVEIVSVSTAGVHGNLSSGGPSISHDGRYVAFVSMATNFGPTIDANGFLHDVFVRDRQVGTTDLVTLNTAGIQADSWSDRASISGDGRFVAFSSQATNLGGAGGATASFPDVFVRDRQSATTELVSQRTDGVAGDGQSYWPSISPDGRFVVFSSNSRNLFGATDFVDPATPSFPVLDVFLRDRLHGTTELVSLSGTGAQANQYSLDAAVSADGRSIAFSSSATNLVPNDGNAVGDVFLRERTLPPILAWCFSDSYSSECPCGNVGLPERGCDNSAGTGGAQLSAAGTASLSNDTVVFTASGELPTALSIFLQGDAPVSWIFGDGVRCAGGALKRLYVKTATGGVAIAPEAGDPSITVRAAALGDVIPLGAARHVQVYYRDPVVEFCASPPGNNWNVTNAITPFWAP